MRANGGKITADTPNPTIGATTPTSFGNGLYLKANGGKITADTPDKTINTSTPTTLTNGQYLYANSGKIGCKTLTLQDLTNGVIKAGDSVSTGTIQAPGSITSNSADIMVSFLLGRIITASSAVVTSGAMTIRTINGYACNKATASGGTYTNLNVLSFSPTCTLDKATGGVRLKITNSTKWVQTNGTAITNNTPVNITCSLTLKFS